MMFGGLIRFIRRVAEKVKFSIFIPANLFQGKERIISQSIVLCIKSRITMNLNKKLKKHIQVIKLYLIIFEILIKFLKHKYPWG